MDISIRSTNTHMPTHARSKKRRPVWLVSACAYQSANKTEIVVTQKRHRSVPSKCVRAKTRVKQMYATPSTCAHVWACLCHLGRQQRRRWWSSSIRMSIVCPSPVVVFQLLFFLHSRSSLLEPEWIQTCVRFKHARIRMRTFYAQG